MTPVIVYLLFHAGVIALALPALLNRMPGHPFALGIVALCSLGFTATAFFVYILTTLPYFSLHSPAGLAFVAGVVLTPGSALASFAGYLRHRPPRPGVQ